MTQFDFIFEELPLANQGDAECCLINGEAIIEYDRQGLWEVVAVVVDGYQGGAHVDVIAPLAIQAMVIERLYGSWHDKVQDAVREQLDLDRELAEEDRADMKLSERKLGL
jgi:hypothetical protein